MVYLEVLPAAVVAAALVERQVARDTLLRQNHRRIVSRAWTHRQRQSLLAQGLS